jgi:hypothetical protein
LNRLGASPGTQITGSSTTHAISDLTGQVEAD